MKFLTIRLKRLLRLKNKMHYKLYLVVHKDKITKVKRKPYIAYAQSNL